MGRFTTHVAATMANADNLPPTDALPKISLLDVLLPSPQKKQTKHFNWPPFKLVRLDADTGKPLDPNVGMRVYREFFDVKKDKNGKGMVVAHKGNGGKKEDVGAGVAKKKGGDGGGDGNNNGNQEQENAKGNAAQQSQDNKPEWTPEQDAKIKSMKAEGKSWAEIAQEVGGTKGLVKNRFNQIKNEGGGEEENVGGEKKDNPKEDNGGGDKTKHEKKKEGKKERKHNKLEAPKASSKARSKIQSRNGENGEARFTMGEWRTLQEDDLFSFGELQCLSELVMRDEQQQWLRIASAFSDTTGRRVHPDDIREKFAEMDRMGSAR